MTQGDPQIPLNYWNNQPNQAKRHEYSKKKTPTGSWKFQVIGLRTIFKIPKQKLFLFIIFPQRIMKGLFPEYAAGGPSLFLILISGVRREAEITYYRSEMVWFGNSDEPVIQL